MVTITLTNDATVKAEQDSLQIVSVYYLIESREGLLRFHFLSSVIFRRKAKKQLHKAKRGGKRESTPTAKLPWKVSDI